MHITSRLGPENELGEPELEGCEYGRGTAMHARAQWDGLHTLRRVRTSVGAHRGERELD